MCAYYILAMSSHPLSAALLAFYLFCQIQIFITTTYEHPVVPAAFMPPQALVFPPRQRSHIRDSWTTLMRWSRGFRRSVDDLGG